MAMQSGGGASAGDQQLPDSREQQRQQQQGAQQQQGDHQAQQQGPQQQADEQQKGQRQQGEQLHTVEGENWDCPICYELLYKPCVNTTCGHCMCFCEFGCTPHLMFWTRMGFWLCK